MFSGILNVSDVNSLYYFRMIACSQTLLLCRGWWPLWHIMTHSGNTPEGFGRHACSSESMEWRQQRERQKKPVRGHLASALSLLSRGRSWVSLWTSETWKEASWTMVLSLASRALCCDPRPLLLSRQCLLAALEDLQMLDFCQGLREKGLQVHQDHGRWLPGCSQRSHSQNTRWT